MESLLQVFSDEEIVELIENNPKIKSMSNLDMSKLLGFITSLGVDTNKLKNIILSNPLYLSRDVSEVDSLFKYLRDIGINNLDIIIDTYPLFLNYSLDDIEEFVSLQENKGLSVTDICEIIVSEPYIIDEIL